MRRRLLRSSAFVRAAKRRVRKDPRVAEDIRAALELLAEDAFHPQLRTHKLKGDLKITRAGSTLGTVSYMSPEQAQGEEVDRRSDIFSLGVMLYELLTGRLPFQGEHQAAILNSIVNEQPQPVARYNSKASPELERISNVELNDDLVGLLKIGHRGLRVSLG